MDHYHLAQINIAEAKAEMESELMSGFVARLDEINALADLAPGFVWRMQAEEDNAIASNVFGNPLMLINISVWENIDALKTYVYRSAHVELIQDRDAWFDKLRAAHQALWWIPRGHLPSPQEGKARLDHIQLHGPTPQAFTFAKPFSPMQQE